MTQVKAKVINENISKDGRTLVVQYTSDDMSINQFLSLPQKWTNTFPLDTKPGKMKQVFVNDIISLINSARESINNNALIGREFTVNIP